jgi:hypothetical protein
MRQIHKKFKRSPKKYGALAKKIQKRVNEALAAHEWSCVPEAAPKKTLSEHPYIKLVDELSAQAMTAAGKNKNSKEKQGLLKKYPWDNVLELVTGLQDGSDRAIPDHENGFINLGGVPDPPPGFPDLMINHYLYGFDEILGWKYRMKQGKQVVYLGREKKTEKSVMETELPPWERIRIYLDGMKPEVSLFAIPWLTRLLHSNLREKRRSESGALSRMDEILAFFDSKWNGFYYQNPYTGKREAFVQPVHMLFTEKGGFVYRFPASKPLAMSGDIPFLSLRTYQEYGQVFLNRKVDVGAFIRDTEEAEKVRLRFFDESVYLARYKSLVDLIVWAILAPEIRYPAYLANFDYPADKVSNLDSRMPERTLDIPRKHALLAWAYSGKDPAKLADFLHDNVLSKEENGFGKDVILAVQFTLFVRQKDREMVDSIVKRIEGERGGIPPTIEGGPVEGAYGPEFSPFPEYGTLEGRPNSDFLAASHRSFHRQVTRVIRKAAMECVIEEIGDKWLQSGR